MFPHLNIPNSSTRSHTVHQEKKIAPKIAANIACVNGPLQGFCLGFYHSHLHSLGTANTVFPIN